MRNELIFHTPCSAKRSYFSKHLCNCERGKARLELTPSVLRAQLGLMRCLLLTGASSLRVPPSSGSSSPLHSLVKVLAEALSNKQLIQCWNNCLVLASCCLFPEIHSCQSALSRFRLKAREQHICVQGLICN